MNLPILNDLRSENITKEKTKDFIDYYTPGIRSKAKRIFGPSMKEWDYSFPDSWGEYKPSIIDKFIYWLASVKILYWKYIK